jgi:hypothetical protein
MTETGSIGIGSTIIQHEETKKYTFMIHPTHGAGIEPITCPNWFDTIEEAKKNGSEFLSGIIEEMKGKARRSTEEERKPVAEAWQKAIDQKYGKGQ